MPRLLSRLAWLTALWLVTFACPRLAVANGCYLPEQAYPAMPAIPVQRAIIVHRNGQETLVVESGVEAPSPSVGWILPLPAEPTRLEKADPGMLVSASMSLRPWLIHDLGRPWVGALWLRALLGPPFLVVALVRDPARRASGWRLAVGGSIMLVIVSGILLPSLASAGSEQGFGDSGIRLLDARKVGNYDVRVLKARTAQELSQWLSSQGLRDLPEAARPAVDGYIRDNWCFLVSVLRVGGGQTAVPHPILATFPAAAPVFPMRLTAVAGSTTRVELTVVSDAGAEAEGFHLVCCDRFMSGFTSFDKTWRGTTGSSRAMGHALRIGSPAVGSLMWPECAVSHLVADLTPQRMGQDVAIRSVPFKPHRDSFWTARGRNELALAILSGGGVILLPALAVACRGRKLPSRSGRICLASISVALALTLLGVYVLIPVVKVGATGGPRRDYEQEMKIAAVLRGSAEQLAAAGDDLPLRVIELIHANSLTAPNNLLGGPRRWERSPGNLGLSEELGRRDLVLYDVNCEGQELIELPTTRPLP